VEERDDEDRIVEVVDQVKGLIKMLESTSVRRVQLEAGRFRIEVERAFAEGGAPAGPLPAFVVEGHGAAQDRSHHRVLAPLVGTYYRTPSPGAKPFVCVGTRVQKGQPIGIIEVMKVMNEVTSDVAGVVTEILIENGQPVQYEQPLMVIDTSAA